MLKPSTYRYKLEQGSKKYCCPSCEKKRFVRYMDSQTGDYLPVEYGRCDREINCGYFHSPYDDKKFLKEHREDDWRRPVKQKPKKPPKFIPVKLFKKSKSHYKNNSFVKYLLSLFDKKAVKKIVKKYHIGTAKKGGCIFYQIDTENNIRRGKIMYYDSSGHRDKKYFGSIHKRLGIKKERYPNWRFFGEHLLNDNRKPIAIVESEKTAIISSVYFPEYIWLASGTKSTLKKKYAQSLKDRTVTLFPDLGAYEDWQDTKLSEICDVTVSDLLERNATSEDKDGGYDLADYLIEFDSNEFRGSTNHSPTKDNASSGKFGTENISDKPEMGIEEFNRRFNSYDHAPF